MLCKLHNINVTGCMISYNCETCLKTHPKKEEPKRYKPIKNKKQTVKPKINRFKRSLFNDNECREGGKYE